MAYYYAFSNGCFSSHATIPAPCWGFKFKTPCSNMCYEPSPKAPFNCKLLGEKAHLVCRGKGMVQTQNLWGTFGVVLSDCCVCLGLAHVYPGPLLRCRERKIKEPKDIACPSSCSAKPQGLACRYPESTKKSHGKLVFAPMLTEIQILSCVLWSWIEELHTFLE